MKTFLSALALTLAAASLTLAPDLADAKRLGGGRPAGMQRSAPPPAQPAAPHQAAPAQNATQPAAAPAPQPAAPAATPGKRSWLGPIAGLAAGLGLAALFSHLGMGEGLGNVVMLALLAVVAVVAIRWLVSRFVGGTPRPQYAGAGAGGGGAGWQPQRVEPAALPATAAPAAAAPAPVSVPGGMDAAEFERLAKMVFVRLQAANDAGNVEDLRKFTTPELFASLRVDLQERGAAAQQTDVVQLDAKVLEVAEEQGQSVVSVRFSGLIRERADAGAEPFAELWHLVRPASAEGDWKIAGIQPQG